jgi:hypothetical protein
MEPVSDEITAYHEAGHAVMALALGRPVHRVSIQPNEDRLGQCDFGKRGTKGTGTFFIPLFFVRPSPLVLRG